MNRVDELFELLLPYCESPAFVHVLLAAPCILMLTNYMRGSCDVAEAVGVEQRSVRLALMALAFAWQVHVVWFVLHDRLLAAAPRAWVLLLAHAAACVVYVVGAFVIYATVSRERAARQRVSRRVSRARDAGGAQCACAATHCHHASPKAGSVSPAWLEYRNGDSSARHRFDLATVTDKPPTAESLAALQLLYARASDYSRVSFCRACDAPFVGRDHHCTVLAVCIAGSTRATFLAVVAAAATFSAIDVAVGVSVFDSIWGSGGGGGVSNRDGSADLLVTLERGYVLAGFFFAIAAALFTGAEALTQCVLMWRSETKVGQARRKEVVVALRSSAVAGAPKEE